MLAAPARTFGRGDTVVVTARSSGVSIGSRGTVLTEETEGRPGTCLVGV
jgi:hypothetical protein